MSNEEIRMNKSNMRELSPDELFNKHLDFYDDDKRDKLRQILKRLTLEELESMKTIIDEEILPDIFIMAFDIPEESIMTFYRASSNTRSKMLVPVRSQIILEISFRIKERYIERYGENIL